MAASVTALQPLKLPTGPSSVTPEQRYWKSFRSQQLLSVPNSSPITHVASSLQGTSHGLGNHPELFAVTSGSGVQIYATRTRKLLKTIRRFGIEDTAHSGEIRRDGRVVVAGGDNGAVQVFDVNSRAILKTWKEHKQPVWTAKWNNTDLTSLMTCSDDRTVRIWDLPSSESVTTLTGHQDYVRCGSFMPNQNSNLLVSGSYDQTVRLWDQRAPETPVMTFKHKSPVECVLPMANGTNLLSTAENLIYVLDLIAGKPLQTLSSHQKTVTALSLASRGTRLVSGALDGHMKVYNTADWTLVAGSKYFSPILSLGVIGSGPKQEDRHVVVGMQSGLLSLKTRLSGERKVQEKQKQREMQALIEGKIEQFDQKKAKKMTQGIRRRLRGIDYDGKDADIVIEGNQSKNRKKLAQWETALRTVQYGKALDLALENPSNVTAMYTLLTALFHRSALRAALANRDEETLQPILKWLVKHVSDPRHVLLTTRVSMLVLEMYAEHLGQSTAIDHMVTRLHDKVRNLVETSQVAESSRGMLDTIMAGADMG